MNTKERLICLAKALLNGDRSAGEPFLDVVEDAIEEKILEENSTRKHLYEKNKCCALSYYIRYNKLISWWKNKDTSLTNMAHNCPLINSVLFNTPNYFWKGNND